MNTHNGSYIKAARPDMYVQDSKKSCGPDSLVTAIRVLVAEMESGGPVEIAYGDGLVRIGPHVVPVGTIFDERNSFIRQVSKGADAMRKRNVLYRKLDAGLREIHGDGAK